METSVITAIDSAVTELTGSFAAITNWWIVGVAVAFFGMSIAIGVVLSLFGKRRRRRK